MPHSYNLDFVNFVDTYYPDQQASLMQDHFDRLFTAVVNSLSKDPNRKFAHYETRYFSDWYGRIDTQRQRLIKSLVKRGQLEFITGGWDMSDESCPTYQDIMVNLHRGHQFLAQNFDYSPRTAWSLETTGNSAAIPRLMSESGIESLFVLNVQPDERKERLKYAEMEFLWRPMYGHLG